MFTNTLLVHRLDRDTSGVMIFAQTEYAQRSLSMRFEKRQVKKVYVARVFGVVTQRIGLINLPLIVDWENRPRQMVCHETGKVAVTEWYKLSSNENESRLRLVPKTGRSHQLRVHCMALGHPILGDCYKLFFNSLLSFYLQCGFSQKIFLFVKLNKPQ